MMQSVYSTALPWIISLCIVLICCIAISKLIIFVKSYKTSSTPMVLALLLIVGVGIFIRFAWVPDGHRILFDEDRYLSYAASFSKFGKAVSLDFATQKDSVIGVPDQAIRVTVPVMHGWILRMFGQSETNLFLFARMMSVLQIVLMFLVGYLVFQNVIIGLWSALGIALLPVSVYWSVSLALDNYFVFFTLLGLVAAALYAKKNSTIHGIFLVSSIVLLICVRFEGILFLPILFATLGYLRMQQKKKRIQTIDIVFTAIIVFCIGIRALLSLSILQQTWCCAESMPLEAFTTQSMVRNILPNLMSFFGQKEFPFIITLLALFAIFKKPNFPVLFMTAWILLFFFLYSLYYAGMFYAYEFSGSYGRYFLIFTVPLLLLSGVTVNYCWQLINTQPIKQRYWILGVTIFLFLATLIPTITSYGKMIRVSPYDRIVEIGPRQMHLFLSDYVLPKIPPNSVLIYPLTANVLMAGHTAIYNDIFNKRDDVKTTVVSYLRKNQRVFILQTYVCDLFPEKCIRFNELFVATEYLTVPLMQTVFRIDELTLKK